MRPYKFRSAGLLTGLLAAGICSGCVAIHIEHRTDMPVAAARIQAIGAPVTVDGVVTVASGTFDEGFALQDASGGIYVLRTPAAKARSGDSVRVSGTIAVFHGQIAIEPARIEILGAGIPPAPLEVRTGMVGATTDGRLIAVRGEVSGDVIDDQPWGWKLYLDDGSGSVLVFISTPTGIDTTGIRAGQSLRAVGYSGRYDRHAEVLPRAPADITATAN